MKKLTVLQAKQWAADNRKELDEKRMSCESEDAQMMNRILPLDKSRELWDSGVWAADMLHEAGADEDTIQSIQMAIGQRAFGGSGWVAAVGYVNEYLSTGDTEEKGGDELAEKRHRELFG